MALTQKPLLDRSAPGVWLEELRRSMRRNVLVNSPDIRIERTSRGTQLFLTETGRRKLGL